MTMELRLIRLTGEEVQVMGRYKGGRGKGRRGVDPGSRIQEGVEEYARIASRRGKGGFEENGGVIWG
jgi:hypothetical protein